VTTAPQPAINSADTSASQTPSTTAAAPAAVPPHAWQEQLAQIQKKLAEHTIGSDRNTHAVDHPVWIEEEKHGKAK